MALADGVVPGGRTVAFEDVRADAGCGAGVPYLVGIAVVAGVGWGAVAGIIIKCVSGEAADGAYAFALDVAPNLIWGTGVLYVWIIAGTDALAVVVESVADGACDLGTGYALAKEVVPMVPCRAVEYLQADAFAVGCVKVGVGGTGGDVADAGAGGVVPNPGQHAVSVGAFGDAAAFVPVPSVGRGAIDVLDADAGAGSEVPRQVSGACLLRTAWLTVTRIWILIVSFGTTQLTALAAAVLHIPILHPTAI